MQKRPLGGVPAVTGAERAGPSAPRLFGEVLFVPARWLALLLAIVRVLFGQGRIGKLGIAGLVWSFAPRKLKIVGAGLAVAAAIVLLGALAAIALLALQLT